MPTEATPLVRQAVTDYWAAQLRCQQRPQACRPGSFTAAQGALRGEIAAAVTTLLTNGWHRGEADEADGGYVAVGPVTIGPDGTTATADECVYDPVPLLDAGGDVVNSVAVPRRIVHTLYLESGTWAVGDEQIDPSAACDLTPDSIPSDLTVPTRLTDSVGRARAVAVQGQRDGDGEQDRACRSTRRRPGARAATPRLVTGRQSGCRTACASALTSALIGFHAATHCSALRHRRRSARTRC